MKHNQHAMAAITKIMASEECPDHNAIHEAVGIAIDPLSQRLIVVSQQGNSIAKLRTVDDDGAICMEWHDVLTRQCETCNTMMSKYNPSGKEYRICDTCAANIPNPLADTFAACLDDGS